MNSDGGKRTEITAEMHGRGVTSISPHPDARLPAPGPGLSQDFLRKWVVPFYMKVGRFGAREKETIVRDLIPLRSELTPDIASSLLQDFNWRTRITGAWFAALMGCVELEDAIGDLLLRSEVCYAGGGYCVALASFATPQSVDHLKNYLSFYLPRIDCWYDQGMALAALLLLDKALGTDHGSSFLPLWRTFTANKPTWHLERYQENLAAQLEVVEQIRPLLY